MDVPEGLRYTADHEWLRVEGDEATVGITAYAADQLGDVVFVELPAVGTELAGHQTFGVIESVKAVSDVISPLSGEVVEVNQRVVDAPETVNEDPYGEGWLIRIRLADPSETDALLDAAAYKQLLAEQ